MKPLCACWLLAITASVVCAQSPTLKEARQRWLHGNYEEARALYEKLAQASTQQPAAAIGLSRTWQSQGQYDKASAVVDSALKVNPSSTELLARRAELFYLQGKWIDAEQAAEKAIASKGDCFLARWIRGQVYRDRADLKRADAEFRWFVRTYSDRSYKDDDVKDPEELLLIGQAGAENARWHNLADQYRVILNDVYGDAVKNEKEFWQAEYECGALLLEKYNRGEALEAFDRALAINPNAAEVLCGKGEAALSRFEVKDAEQLADRALRINPNLTQALRLRADIQLMAGDLKSAQQTLQKARQVNPRDERTLARVAACLLLSHDQGGFDSLVAEVRRHDPKPAIFYFELGDRLEQRQLFDAAEQHYKTAMELRPMLPWSLNSLGLLYMRMGREKEAQEVLTRAFKADEFNVRVSNTLKVLRHLEKYETLTTDHFLLKFDPENDRRLARYLAPYLENLYTELSRQFQYKPEGKILIEVFNSHDMFSGRITSLPDLHTIGACTGRVMAMVSPHGKGIQKPFNWGRVVRHELVHMFNLDQTRFQVPHWLTEGIAVGNEGFPRPQEWNLLLRERVPADNLLNLDNIEAGFIRPRSPLDWHMAYCQSQMYVDFLRQKYGPQSIGGLLQAYHDELDTAAALSKVCHVEKPTFEKEYRQYVRDVAKTLQGRPIEKKLTFGQLQREHDAEPENLDISARLAEQFLLRRDKKEARQLAEAVLAKQAKHGLATYVKARLLLDAGEDEQAKALLESAVDRKSPEPKVLQGLGKLYFEARDFAKAADVYELGHKAEPAERKWLAELVRVYTQLGDKNKRIEMLKLLVPLDPDELDQRKRLAQMLLEEGRHSEAETYAREALEIDVRDAEAQEYLNKALVGQNKTEEADRIKKLLEK